MPSPSIPAARAIALLRLLARGEKGEALYSLCGSPDTLTRDLVSLRRDLGVDVQWIPTERRYVIEDWGVLNRRKLLATAA